jgi:hypothetical protein
MNKEMINTNKAVVVYFDPYASELQITNTASADIYVPFLVKEIHVRGIDLDFMSDFQPLYFTSSLVNNGPLGSGYAGILCDTSVGTRKLRYIFDTPREINGSYSFTYHIFNPEKISFHYPAGFASGGVNAYALASPAIAANAEPGAPPGNVLFMLEFIAYKN